MVPLRGWEAAHRRWCWWHVSLRCSCGHWSPSKPSGWLKIARTSRDRVRLPRAGIVLASLQGRGVSEIAGMFAATDGHVREVMHAFNDRGFAALDPKWSGGRP